MAFERAFLLSQLTRIHIITYNTSPALMGLMRSYPGMVARKKPRIKKETRYSEELIQECLEVLESGDVEELFEIIPHLGVVRDSRFNKYLVDFLGHDNTRVRQFAAEAMGAVGQPVFLRHLKKVFLEAGNKKGFGGDTFLGAILQAIGDIGDDRAVEFLVPSFEDSREQGRESFKVQKWVLESLGTIAQQGGEKCLGALLDLAQHVDPVVRAQAITEISGAYWHRPNEIPEEALRKLQELTQEQNESVADSALAALQELADVGCRGAESFLSPRLPSR